MVSLIENAVNFLKDPEVSIFSLAKKISFLETKGLDSSGINEALKLAGLSEEARLLANSEVGNLPPLPTTMPRIVTKRKSWYGVIVMIVAFLGGTGVVLSQLDLSPARYFFSMMKARLSLLFRNQIEDEIAQIKRDQAQLTEALSHIKEHLKKEMEAIQASQKYLYRQLENDFELLREEFKSQSIHGESDQEEVEMSGIEQEGLNGDCE